MNTIRRRKLNPAMLAFYWLLSVYLSVFVAVASEPKNPHPTSNPTIILTGPQSPTAPANQHSAKATTDSHNIKYLPSACPWCWIIAFLIFLGILIWIVAKICHALKNLGKHLNPPPDDPNHNNGNSSVRTLTVTTNNNLPVAVYPITQTTNVAGQAILSGLLGVTNNTELLGTAQIQGIGIGDYAGTNSQVINGNLIDWTGATLLNFSILQSSNLTDWHGLCTVMEWVNTVPTNSFFNPTNVWICQAVYTNTITGGTTNGTLANVIWINVKPTFSNNDFVATNATVYGTIVPVIGTTQLDRAFFRLTCNTNATDEQLIITP